MPRYRSAFKDSELAGSLTGRFGRNELNFGSKKSMASENKLRGPLTILVMDAESLVSLKSAIGLTSNNYNKLLDKY